MANVPIPPLLCNTPPPIDFGDEDEEDSGLPPTLTLDLDDEDEFGEYSLPTKMDTSNKNIDVPSLPHTPTPPDIMSPPENSHDSTKVPSNFELDSNAPGDISKDEQHIIPLETFNPNVSTGNLKYSPLAESFVEKDSDFSDTENLSGGDADAINFSTAATTIGSVNSHLQKLAIEEQSKEMFSTDAINESDQQQIEMCKISPTYKEKTTSYISEVTVEDMDDSSDDECRSPNKLPFTSIDENSEDFFAIRLVSNEEGNSNKTHWSDPPADNSIQAVSSGEFEAEDFDDFACFEEPIISNAGDNVVVDPAPQLSYKSEIIEKFHKLSDSVVEQPSNEESQNNTQIAQIPSATSEVEFGAFEEFQDFRITEANDLNLPNENAVDDDFGDFSEATFTPAIIPTQCITQAASLSANESPLWHVSNLIKRLQPVLEIMFPNVAVDLPTTSDFSKQCESDKKNIMTVNPIDSAKALDFQWARSELRHALIKSLGIDSRNILFGEKWNSSMPRFAANLGVSPLQPMKQHPNSVVDSTRQIQQRNETGTSKGDVPAVEFDWNSSGLVNPLDGSAGAVQAGEAKAMRRTQSGELHELCDHEPLPLSQPQSQQQQLQQRQWQQVHGTDGDADAATDGSTATTTVAAAATAEVSPDVLPDSIGNCVYDNSNHTDLGIVATINANGSSEVTAILDNDTEFSQGGLIASRVLEDEDNGEGNTFEICNNGVAMQLDASPDCEVVTTSTYAGPLKETHIYTPPKGDGTVARTIRAGVTAVTKVEPVDFDYEIAAAGIIIDETVVKKEYRDVEYNPGFGLAVNGLQNNELTAKVQSAGLSDIFIAELMGGNANRSSFAQENKDVDFDEEFSDFQSVAPPAGSINSVSPCSLPPSPLNLALVTGTVKNKEREMERERATLTITPTIGDEMILSPAILLPQAILMERSKPKIEWGESATNINPEELARIEELFPQPKSAKTKEAKKETTYISTPTRKEHVHNSLSISASIAQKEQDASGEDDDWTEFVSVPITAANSNTKTNNNHLLQESHRLPILPPQHHYQHHHHQQLQQQHRASPKPFNSGEAPTNNSNDEEWSDYVSNASVADATNFRAVPQFNSAAWQNANFYNNPLSFYHQRHQSPSNVMTSSSLRKLPYQNNNNIYNNNNINQHLHIYQQQYLQRQHQTQAQPQPQSQAQKDQLRLKSQEIHVMQDFSTAAPYRPSGANVIASAVSGAANTATHFSQFQVGSAKVAPSISLIPDLGFVAPGVPTHTSLIHSLSLPGFTAKK